MEVQLDDSTLPSKSTLKAILLFFYNIKSVLKKNHNPKIPEVKLMCKT